MNKKNLLLIKYEPLVRKLTTFFYRKCTKEILFEDLYSAGMICLWKAIEKSELNSGGEFEAYIRIRIRGSFIDELRNQDWLTRTMRENERMQNKDTARNAKQSIVYLESLSEKEENSLFTQEMDYDDLIESKEKLDIIKPIINQMSEKHINFINMYFFKESKRDEIMREFKISESRVTHMRNEIIDKLKSNKKIKQLCLQHRNS